MSSVGLNNLCIKDLEKLVKKEYNKNKKLKEDVKKDKLIAAYQKLQKQNNKLKQEENKIHYYQNQNLNPNPCLLYTSDAADE